MNATVTVEGIQLSVSNLGLPRSSDWYAWNFDRAIETSGAANYETEGQEAETVASSLDAFGDAFIVVNGITATSETGELNATGTAFTDINGIELQSDIGEVSASVVIPVSATVEITGVQITASITPPTVRVASDEIVRASGVSRRATVQIQDQVVGLLGIKAKIEASELSATGTVVISAVATLNSQNMAINADRLNADGILGISDEELVIFLMAA